MTERRKVGYSGAPTVEHSACHWAAKWAVRTVVMRGEHSVVKSAGWMAGHLVSHLVVCLEHHWVEKKAENLAVRSEPAKVVQLAGG